MLCKISPEIEAYLIAEHDKRVVGFLTYTPIYGRQGVDLNLMRRGENAQTGTMDLLLSESFRLQGPSGVNVVTRGRSPLAKVQDSPFKHSKKQARLLHRVSVQGKRLIASARCKTSRASFSSTCGNRSIRPTGIWGSGTGCYITGSTVPE